MNGRELVALTLAGAALTQPTRVFARDLIPLDRYQPSASQTGITISFSGEQVAWTAFGDSGARDVLVAPVDDLTRARSLVRPGEGELLPLPLWVAGERLLVLHRTARRAWLDDVDTESGETKRTLASGAEVRVFDIRSEQIGIGVYQTRSKAAPPPSELRPPDDPTIAEELIVYGAKDTSPLDIRLVDLGTGVSKSVWTGRAYDKVYFDEDLEPRVAVRHNPFWYWSDGRWMDYPASVRLDELQARGGHRSLRREWLLGPMFVAGVSHDQVALIEPYEGVSSLVLVGPGKRDEQVVLQSLGPDIVQVSLDDDLHPEVVTTYDERFHSWSSRSEAQQAVAAISAASGGDVVLSYKRGDRAFGWVYGPTEPGAMWMADAAGSARRLLPDYCGGPEVSRQIPLWVDDLITVPILVRGGAGGSEPSRAEAAAGGPPRAVDAEAATADDACAPRRCEHAASGADHPAARVGPVRV